MRIQERSGRNLLILVLVISGGCGLIYEVVCSRILTLLFGTSIYAVSAVLAGFMAGLAIGSWIFGRISSRYPRPLLLYALLEIGIGITALVTLFLFHIFREISREATRAFVNLPGVLLILRFGISLIILLPITLLMGGTLPAVIETYVRARKQMGEGVGTLYGVNTFGAVLGTGFAGMWAIGYLGLNKTFILAALLNFAVALTVIIFFAESRKPVPILEEKRQNKPKGSKIQKDSSFPALWFLIAYGLSGFAALGYEVTWTRILSLYVFNSTYGFTAILVTFLIGLSAGSFLIRRYVDKFSNLVFTFGIMEFLLGIAVLLVFYSFTGMDEILWFLRNHMGFNFLSVVGFALILSFLVAILPTLLMGALFPVATKAYKDTSQERPGESVGRIYAANTIGTVLGSFSTGFLLIPLFSAPRVHIILALLNLGIGYFFLFKSKRLRNIQVKIGLIFLSVILLFASYRASFLKLHPVVSAPHGPSPELIFHKEGPSATVTVFKYPKSGHRTAYVNGTFIISDSYDALKTVRLLAHLPVLLNSNFPPQKALVIGFGMGVTTSELALYPLKSIICVEISPEVLEAASLFGDLNRNILNDPRIRIVIEDGRNFLWAVQDTFDIITVDPNHPLLGSGPLYTREFYKDCLRHLKTGGIMAQYLPLHLLSPYDFKSLIKTFSSLFNFTTLWMGHTHTVLLGSDKFVEFDIDRIEEALKDSLVLFSLRDSDLGETKLILAHYLTGPEGLYKLAKDYPIHVDDRPFVEFSGHRSIGINTWPLNMNSIIEVIKSPGDLLNEKYSDLAMWLRRSIEARKEAYRGMVLYSSGEKIKALVAFQNAREKSPEDPALQRLLGIASRDIPFIP